MVDPASSEAAPPSGSQGPPTALPPTTSRQSGPSSSALPPPATVQAGTLARPIVSDSRPDSSSSPIPTGTGPTGPERGGQSKGHRHRPSLTSSSIEEIRAKVQHARRMSQTVTPQGLERAGLGGGAEEWEEGAGGWGEWGIRRAGSVVAGLMALALISGTALSIVLGSAQNTSHFSLIPPPSMLPYFASRKNVLNLYVVKLCWFWTTVVYLGHLWTAPSSTTQSSPTKRNPLRGKVAEAYTPSSTTVARARKTHRLLRFVLASALFSLFTGVLPPGPLSYFLASPSSSSASNSPSTWSSRLASLARTNFGPGLGDRIISLTGGQCAVPLPVEWSTESAVRLLSSRGHLPLDVGGQGKGGPTVIPLEDRWCAYTARPLTPSSAPPFFEGLPELADLSGGGVKRGRRLRPRWVRGFDISGHAVLMTLSGVIIAQEVSSTWTRWFRTAPRLTSSDSRSTLIGGRQTGVLHNLFALGGTALLGVWVGMMFVTGLYFHRPYEKLCGLGLGLVGAVLVDFLTPRPASIQSTPVSIARPGRNGDDGTAEKERAGAARRGDRRTSAGAGEDENRARRGSVVDDGVVIEEESEDAEGSDIRSDVRDERGKQE